MGTYVNQPPCDRSGNDVELWLRLGDSILTIEVTPITDQY